MLGVQGRAAPDRGLALHYVAAAATGHVKIDEPRQDRMTLAVVAAGTDPGNLVTEVDTTGNPTVRRQYATAKVRHR